MMIILCNMIPVRKPWNKKTMMKQDVTFGFHNNETLLVQAAIDNEIHTCCWGWSIFSLLIICLYSVRCWLQQVNHAGFFLSEWGSTLKTLMAWELILEKQVVVPQATNCPAPLKPLAYLRGNIWQLESQ